MDPFPCAGHGMSRCAENAVCQEKAERREMHPPRRLCRSVRISSRCWAAFWGSLTPVGLFLSLGGPEEKVFPSQMTGSHKRSAQPVGSAGTHYSPLRWEVGLPKGTSRGTR